MPCSPRPRCFLPSVCCSHHLRVAPAEASALLEAPPPTPLLIDGRRELPHIRSLCRVLRTTGVSCPLLLVTTEGGLAAVTAEWGVDDVLLESAGPAEVEARHPAGDRPARGQRRRRPELTEIRRGDVTIDEATYTAKVRGRSLDLTFKEFELLKFLAQHPGRVFTRAQLLQEVWGYDYYGGTRTVDVHVRRLRAKLGTEHEQLIGTVRNVGYRFVLPPRKQRRWPAPRRPVPRPLRLNAPRRHDRSWPTRVGDVRTRSPGRPPDEPVTRLGSRGLSGRLRRYGTWVMRVGDAASTASSPSR